MDAQIRAIVAADGVPYLTKSKDTPLFASQDPDKGGPKDSRVVKVDILDLSLQKHFIRYQRIWEAVGVGTVVVADEERQWVSKKANWKVIIKWFMNHMMDPTELKAKKTELVNELL